MKFRKPDRQKISRRMQTEEDRLQQSVVLPELKTDEFCTGNGLRYIYKEESK